MYQFQATKDLSGFSVMFLIIYFAFVQLGYLLFGVQVSLKNLEAEMIILTNHVDSLGV